MYGFCFTKSLYKIPALVASYALLTHIIFLYCIVILYLAIQPLAASKFDKILYAVFFILCCGFLRPDDLSCLTLKWCRELHLLWTIDRAVYRV